MNSTVNATRDFCLTIFQASKKPKGEQRHFTHAEFAESLMPRLGEKDGPGFSPATFKNNHRGRDNLISIGMIVLDVEENKKTGEIPTDPQEITKRVNSRGLTGFIYTTYNHTPENPRYRVALLLSHSILFSDDPRLRSFEHEVFREVCLHVADDLGLSGVIDTSKLGGESLFFFPRYPASGKNHAKLFLNSGGFLEADDLWRACQQKVAARQNRAASRKEPSAFNQQAVQTNTLIGKIRDRLPPLREKLSQLGYSYHQASDRYTHPSSSSGMPGVIVFMGDDGIERFYSHHASDPLGGDTPVFGSKAHDVVDLEIADRFGTARADFEHGLRTLAREHHIEGAFFLEERAERYPLSRDISAPSQVRFVLSPLDYKSLKKVPRREKLYGAHLFARYLSATIAPGGAGKTTLLIAENVDIASGGKVFGRTQQPMPVLYWNGEDPFDELQRRVAAVCKYYSINEVDLGGRLFLSSGRNNPLVIGAEIREGAQINEPVIEQIKSEILKHGIRVVIIDPFVSCHQVDENDNRRIDQIAKTLSKLAEETNCAIELVHHVRKLGPDAEITANDSRGASSLLAAARVVRVFNRATEGDMGHLLRPGEQGDHRAFFRICNDKVNMTPPSDKSDWYRIVSVQLDNGDANGPGDNVGVVCRAEVVSPFDSLTLQHLKAFQCRLMDTGDQGLAYNPQAKDWAGYELAKILGWDPAEKATRGRLTKVIDKYIQTKVVKKRSVKKPGKSEHQPRLFCGEAV
jgi:hypothetical protein